MKLSAALLFLVFFVGSCKKKEIETAKSPESSIKFSHIVMLGNSITIHPPLSSVGWYGNWGMAASTRDSDYVHIIAKRLKANVTPVNIANWEQHPESFEFAGLNKYFADSCDLVIIRLGENVQNLKDFQLSFEKLVEYVLLKASGARVLITGTFWKNDGVNAILSLVAKEHNIKFLALSYLDVPESKSSIGSPTYGEDGMVYSVINQGVADHPGNEGMKKIAESILNAVTSN